MLERLKLIDKKSILIATAGVAGLVALISGGVYCLPYLTLNNMKNATTNRNADALSQEIDFPSLRTSIKDNVKAQIIKQITESGTSGVPSMTPALIDKMVIPVVDKLITPEGLEQLMQDKVPEVKIDLANLDRDIAKSDIKMGYESLDRFVIHITDKVDRAKAVSLVLKRNGLAWKLSGIDISKV
jgi:hypothetical protein